MGDAARQGTKTEMAGAAPGLFAAVRGTARWGAMEWMAVAVLILFASVPFSGDIFYVSLFTRLMVLAIAAVSLNLILGYGGMISLGHAAFIGIGAYSVGVPAYYDIYNGWLHLALAAFFSGLFALITGAISLRTKGVHFIMITMAFSQMAFFAAVSIEEYGGDDGLVISSRSVFAPFGDVENNVTLYYVTLVALAASVFVVWRIVNSRFGMVIRGAMANEPRMRAIGYNTYVYRLVCYVIAGIMSGIAGALMANFTDFISPDLMHWFRSGELMFMVILGGSGTIFGPVFGTAIYLLLEEFLSRLWVFWQLPFGVLLILVVLYARGGLAGLLSRRRRGDG
jgi:branched-chain amino acid transport system permease protein